MSGKNISVFELPPGIFSDVTQYGAGQHWFNGNMIRWYGNTMVPIGGWRALADFGTAPVVTAQVPPAYSGANIAPGGTFTFAAAPLGANAGKYVLIGVATKYSTPGSTNAPSVTIDGLPTTRINVGLPGYAFAEWYISNEPFALATGTIVVTNTSTSRTLEGCGVFPYMLIGPPSPITYVTADNVNQDSLTTAVLDIPPKTRALGIAISPGTAANLTWVGSLQDNTLSAAALETRRHASSGLNTISETLSSSGINISRGITGIVLPEVVGNNPIRDMISWRDLLKKPWIAAGSADKLWGLAVISNGTYTQYDITPTTLVWNPGGSVGFGSGPFGQGPYSIDSGGGASLDATAQWSMDNFGKLLIAVHSQDGRLFSWDPVTPVTVAVPVLNAPLNNTLCISTNEEFCMVLGGVNNPRRVKWASQRSLSDWTPTELNSAGGFDLQSHGAIRAAVKVPEGVLVVTGADVHLIQYIGPPNYYGRRKISDEGSIIGKNALVAIPNGAMWMGNSDFWMYVGGNVVRMPCSVHTDVFYKSELSQAENVFLGVNEFAGEVWAFYPPKGGINSNQYVTYSYVKEPYWSKGHIYRTAMLNPVWQAQPLMVKDQTLYEHEYGALDNGAPRVGIFAETGALEIGEGDDVMRVDRVYQDSGVQSTEPAANEAPFTISDPLAYDLTFKLRQAPNGPSRTYGPVSLGDKKGYTTVRFRARQFTMRVDQNKDEIWTLGKLRLRLKPGGKR